MKPLKHVPIFLLLLARVGLPEATEGQTVGYSIASNLLMELNLETGDFSAIGPIGAVGFGGLTMAADGDLYGVSYFTDDLWRIDPSNGNSTLIGPIGIDVEVDTGLAFDACGTLWMFTNRRLYEVDPSAGAATLISSFAEEIRGLTARGEELLALAKVAGAGNRLAVVDPRTGRLSLFGEIVNRPTFQQGLDFDNQGRLWGIYWMDGPIPGPWVSSFVSYDPPTGQILSILEVGIAQLQPVFEGNLAISPPHGVCGASAPDVPTSSATSLLMLALLLGSAGLLVIRRLQASR